MKLYSRLKPVTLAATFLTLSLVSSVSSAAEQLDAHEHGAARMTIATSDKGLEVTLESPGANLFGFEHAPSKESDHAAIREAMGKLAQGGSLIVANASAGCTQEGIVLESAQVDAHQMDDHDEHDHDEKKEDKHDDHDHDEHDHDEKKADKHDDHDHDEHDHEEEGATHNDVDVTWHFECKDAAKLEQVEVKLFSAFPNGFEDLDIDWITASKSGHAELEKDGVVSLK
ncbi:DUF2796 domain-containing protein [Leucothrix sargassi]|nr:DUF2796 domain-containing protein [Leucothrix sargassi]